MSTTDNAVALGRWSDDLGREIGTSDRRALVNVGAIKAGTLVEVLTAPDAEGLVEVHQRGKYADIYASDLAPVVVTANTEVIQGLREVAALLEAHPELPAFRGFVHCGVYDRSAREKLTRFAAVLGEHATEKVTDYASVIVGADLSGVTFEMRTTVERLGGRAARPLPAYDYEPILKPPRLSDGLVDNGRDTEDGES